MFQSSIRKFRNIEAAVQFKSEKYFDVLEALHIATIDLDDSKSSPIIPETTKLNKLAIDLNRSLDEAHLELQTVMCRIRSQIVELVNEELGKGSYANESKVSEVVLKRQLSAIYDEVMEVIDCKTTVLQIVHRTCDHFVKSVATLGDENGALQSCRKTELVTSPLFTPLQQNKFFATSEVNVMSRLLVIFDVAVILSFYHFSGGSTTIYHKEALGWKII